jgi:NAD(P)-dependent dehydrogenase (short-subunit alcohol dehydrogenase family)
MIFEIVAIAQCARGEAMIKERRGRWRIGSEFEKQMVARTPLGRLGQPDDIASVAVFLASAASG